MEPLLSALSEIFAWTLKASGQASVLILLVLLAQWILRGRLSPAWRYGLWLLVLVRLLLPSAPQSSLSLFNFAPTGVRLLSVRTDAAEIGNTAANRVGTEASSVPSESVSIDHNPSRYDRPLAEETPNSNGVPLESGKDDRTVGNRSDASGSPNSGSWLLAFSFIWLAGALVIAARVACVPAQLNRQLARDHSLVEPALLEALEEAKECMGIRKVLPVVQSAAVQSPALMGFIRPWLLLPEGMAGQFTRQELRLVFLHELAHLKRRDIAVNWLMTLLQILHWFNPLVWFAFNRMRADREVACDALALSRAREGEQQPYGETVLKLLKSFSRPAPMAGLAGILEDKQQMKRRMEMIARFNKTSHGSVVAITLFAALGLVSLTDAQTKSADDTSNRSNPSRERDVTLRKLPDLSDKVRFYAVDVSPDGRYVLGNLIVGDKGNNTVPMLIDIRTGEERRFEIADDGPGWPVAQGFSSDGKQIACVRLWEDRTNAAKELLLLDVETGTLRRVYRNENIVRFWYLGWSFDGQTVVATFEREKRGGRREIGLISVTDGTDRMIEMSDASIHPGFCAFSKDGRWIAYEAWKNQEATWRSNIRLLAADGSQDVALVDHPGNDRLIGWHPSSGRIIFRSDRRGSWDFYSLQVADGESKREPKLLGEIGDGIQVLRLTPNGDFFFRKNTNHRDVYFAEINPSSGKISGAPRKAARVEGRNQYPAWSHDSRYLAYIASDGQDGTIGICDVETGAVREVQSAAGHFSFPHWAPDGKSIFALSYELGDSFAYRVDAESGEATKLTTGVPLIYNAWPLWSWSPDGASFFQFGRNGLTRFDVETNRKEEIQIDGVRGSTALSPDCRQIATSVARRNESGVVTRTISVLPITGGTPRKLVELFGPEAIEEIHLFRSLDNALGWTPDNNFVLFVKGNTEDQNLRSLWRVPAAGGEPEELGLEMDRLRHPVISPDGRRIAFTAGGSKSELWVMENFLPKGDAAVK